MAGIPGAVPDAQRQCQPRSTDCPAGLARQRVCWALAGAPRGGFGAAVDAIVSHHCHCRHIPACARVLIIPQTQPLPCWEIGAALPHSLRLPAPQCGVYFAGTAHVPCTIPASKHSISSFRCARRHLTLLKPKPVCRCDTAEYVPKPAQPCYRCGCCCSTWVPCCLADMCRPILLE